VVRHWCVVRWIGMGMATPLICSLGKLAICPTKEMR
jgi:hypothetical protein